MKIHINGDVDAVYLILFHGSWITSTIYFNILSHHKLEYMFPNNFVDN